MDGMVYIETELVGYDKSEIKVSLNNSTLTIAAHKTESEPEDAVQKKYLFRERMFGYKRMFAVRKTLTKSEVAITYADGLLTVKFPETSETPETDNFIEIQ